MDLFGHSGVGNSVRDPLGRVYTPQKLADAIAKLLLHRGRPKVALDPAVGSGAFPRGLKAVFPGIHVIGIDIDPDAAGATECDEFICGDWLELSASFRGREDIDVAATNPPYTVGTGRFNDDGAEISEGVIGRWIDATVGIASITSFLLPAATLFCGNEAEARAALDRSPPTTVHRVPGRPWKFLREAAVFEWVTDAQVGDIEVRFRPVHW